MQTAIRLQHFSANEKTANRNERKALTERIAFYDAVLDALSPRSVENTAQQVDKQGNPLNEDGTLKVEVVASIDEISDADFMEPTRSIQLPMLPRNVDEALDANGKPVVIKKNIFERNATRHYDLTPEQSRDILRSALYNPSLYGQNQKNRKPYNWVVISVATPGGPNRLVLLEINNNRDSIDVVHWHYIDERGIEKIKRQAEREDGQLLILPPNNLGEVGALSDPTLNMPSTGKDTTSLPNDQTSGQEKSHITSSFTPGLVEDEYTAKLSEKSRKALHDVAVALGLRVRFVDAVRTAAGGLANADISGNEVRIAWSKRDKAISFLVGHEFTHRMQELSPKEYASFKESVKAYMGDERWNALVAKTRSIYEAHNAREMARAEAEHRAPRLLQYSVELIEDEVVADFAGELNEDANALAAFAEKLAEKPSTLKAVIAVLRDILNKLKGLVAGAEAQRLANMLSKFEELYRASASRTTEGQTQSKEKYSLSTIKELKASLDLYSDTSNIDNFVSTVKDIAFGGGGNEHLKNIVLDYEEAADEALFAEQIGNIVGDFNGSLAPYTAGGQLFSLPSQIADILNDYDTEGAEYGSILDVADGIEALIAASAEDTTELENILNDFRAAQDDARRWGNRMDSGGEEEFEKALRAYASQSKARYSISATELAEIEAERKSIIETAKANGTYLKAPNGKDTNLTPEQWIEVRTKRFKAWFGDWEKAARIEKLRKSENVSISGNEIVPSGDMKEYRKNALEYGKTIRGEYVNTDTGSLIVINKDSLTEVLHHDGSNIAHIQSIAAIPQMVESGIYITSEPISETASKKLRNAKKAHYYVCGLNIGDVPYTVKFVVAEFESGEKYYDHSLTEIEKGELLNRAELSSTVAESKTPISDIKDKRLISILQTNSSKIVDANGEPKEVFHGTPNDFYVFGEDVSSKRPWTYEDTFYFTDSEKNAKTYGGRIVGAFLNIRNPYVYDFEGRSWRNLRFDIAVIYGRDNSILASGFATKEEAQAWLANFKKENPEHYAVKDENGRFLIVNEKTITGQAGLTTDEQTQTAKAEGYDGNIQKNISDTAGGKRVVGEDGMARWEVDPEVSKPHTNYVVYDSRQIKSSTENVGTYDATNPDIRYSLITPEMDASYLDAVERGDMETAQRMVLEAAKLAMPDTEVVDDDGNPKVVYHGTPNLFNVFSKEMFGTSTDRGIWGNGFYFSESPKYADTYKSREGKEGRTISAYLNIKSPLHIYVSRRDDEGQAYFHALMEKHFNDEVYADVTKQEENMRKAQYELSAEMINDGYDGVIVHYPNDFMGNEYIAFEPNQIKSADPVTYDDNGNVIPLSERFNFEKEDIRYSIPSQPIFYSNAEYAVRGIKQEKATPEQWLKMIEKNGGLKAGEDKWLGLSDWLKASDKKTLTKDEVLQYIAENDIQIEEVEYAQFGPGLIDEATRKLEAEMREIGIEAMREKYDGFDDLFEVYNGELLWSEERASEGEYEDFIIENNIVDVNAQANAINETRLGYTTSGLDNKREIALTVPAIEPWNTADNIHFGDAGEGRAVAWVRFGETTDADGKRVLVIDEIQSKRHQEGREKGYSDNRVSQQELYDAQEEAFSKVIDYESALADKYGEDEWASLASEEEMAEYERLRAIDEAATNAYENYDKGIPSAPFEKNWAELAMKRMLRYAAENGFDKVAWTTGDQQAERYGMHKAVSKIVRRDNSLVEGKRFLLVGDTIVPHKITVSDEGIIVASTIENIEGKALSEVMGKEVALKMMQMGNEASLESANLRIGGEGMKAFYDQMLPSFVRKYAKKWGATVGEVTMPDLEKNNTMHSVDVTPAMRESVMQGQPKFSLRGSDKSLVGLHNISLDKLRKAIKMGGLANPSVAVIDVDKATHEDYGDYTLVLTSNMVDARLGRNAGTWAGDAWTPTYPQVTKRIPMSKDITRFHKDINKMPEAIRNRVRLQWDSFLDGRDANSFAYWYLFEKGVAPEMAVIPPVFPDDIVKMVSEATDGTFNMWQKSDEQKARCVDAYIAYKYDGDRAAYEADLQSRKERLQRALNTTKSQLVVKKAAGDLAALEEFGFDYDAVSTFLREVETDNSRRGQSDVQGTIRLAENYIKDNNLEEDYQSWRDSLEGRYGVKEYIFNGYTDSGNQRWLPHTTANASKWMKKQGREGATGTFPSFGLFVATVIPRMTKLNTIRKRKGHLGRPEQEYEEFEEKWKNVYYELGQKLQPDAERFEDYGWWRLIEAISTNNPKEFIKKQYGIDISAEDMQKLNDMLDAIKSNYPARYFETKFERPVELNEFIAAIVPNDIPADVEASLQEAYLNIYIYDKGVEGSRQEAVLEATDSPNVRFSLRLPKVEYASLSSIIMTRQHTYQRPSFDYAFTAHNFYVYDYLGDGDSIINFAMPIVGNEEIIDVINKAIDNGAITDARSLDTLLEEIQSGKRGYNVNIVNALKKRGWNKNIYISGSSRQGRNTRGVSNVSKSHSGLSPRKRAGGNTDESAHKGVETRLSMPMPDDIFFDDNGDIISFGGDDVREATTIVRRAPKTTKERIKMYMESRHYDSRGVSSGSFI